MQRQHQQPYQQCTTAAPPTDVLVMTIMCFMLLSAIAREQPMLREAAVAVAAGAGSSAWLCANQRDLNNPVCVIAGLKGSNWFL